MNHHTDQRFQREAHGDVRFSVTTRTAGHRMARNCNAQQGMELQSNADRPLATAGFPGRFGPSAIHGTAGHVTAQLSTSKQRGSELGNRLFSGPLWSDRTASQCMALQRNAKHRNAIQSNADRSLATGSFPGRFGPKEAPLTAKHRTASHRTAEQSNSRQRISKQRGLPTGNSGFSGPLWLTRPGFPSRFINGLTTEKTTWP